MDENFNEWHILIIILAKADWILFIVLNGLKANPIHELPPALAGG